MDPRSALRATLFVSLALACLFAPAEAREGERSAVVYEGELVDGVRSGHGVLTWSDGSRYEGQFDNGVRHGQGTLLLPTGDLYTGEFQHDAMTGQGRLEWTNGDVYEGDFVDGERTGEGSYLWRNGARYRGGLLAGIPHGDGIYEYPDGTIYRGQFEHGTKTGRGELSQDGTRYRGGFADDERHGLGHYRSRDGTLFKGHFAFGRQNGPGVKETPAGELSFEVWDAGRLVAAMDVMAVERCELTIESAPWMFDGDQCINGLAHGRGTAVRLDGSAYIEDGRFVLGQFVSGELVSITLEQDPRNRLSDVFAAPDGIADG